MGYPSYILANVIDNNEMERGWREMSPACPRCGSSNTKFCYYNNYSLTQPRYFCKGCRRYWTKGGSLRNVPVGGGCRKSRRSRSSTLRLTTTTTPPSNHNLGVITSRNATMHGGHHHHNHHEHGGAHGSLVNDVGDSGTSSEAPAIDLASVYANFLNQKPQTNNPPQVDISSIPDATTIAPTFNVDCSSNTSNNNNNNINDPLSFSQKLPTIPELIMNNNNNNNNHDDIDHHHHNNQVLFVTEFSTPMMIHHDHHRHQHHNEDASSIQHNDELGLPPLPGGDSFMSHHHHHHHHHQQQQPLTWVASDLDHDHDHHQQHYHHHHHRNDVDNNSMQVLQDLETDSQFSNLFNNAGSWSPLNFPGFETSSSSSKP